MVILLCFIFLRKFFLESQFSKNRRGPNIDSISTSARIEDLHTPSQLNFDADLSLVKRYLSKINLISARQSKVLDEIN